MHTLLLTLNVASGEELGCVSDVQCSREVLREPCVNGIRSSVSDGTSLVAS